MSGDPINFVDLSGESRGLPWQIEPGSATFLKHPLKDEWNYYDMNGRVCAQFHGGHRGGLPHSHNIGPGFDRDDHNFYVVPIP